MNEPIILPSIERAQTWIELCAKGLSVPAEKAASILAALCGFGSWDVMTYSMESMPPSPADEDLEPEQYRDRLKGQVHILVGEHQLDPTEAIMLLRLLPPASREPQKAFKITDSVGFTEQQMQAFMEYAGEFTSGMPDEMRSEPLQSILEDPALQDNAAAGVRLDRPLLDQPAEHLFPGWGICLNSTSGLVKKASPPGNPGDIVVHTPEFSKVERILRPVVASCQETGHVAALSAEPTRNLEQSLQRLDADRTEYLGNHIILVRCLGL